MGAIRAGGLASGLDTNAIIESLVEAAKEPIYRLDNSYHLLTLEKSLYKDINSDLTGMKNAIFNLRLESAFKSKTSISTNLSVANARVTSEAEAGSHIVEVLQTARNASMVSTFTSLKLTEKGAGVSGVYSTASAYEQLEGLYTTKVYEDGSLSKSIAKTTFKSNDNRVFFQYSTGSAISDQLVDSNGTLIQTAITTLETVEFSINTGSGPVSLGKMSVDDLSPFQDIQSLMFMIETGLNNQINAHMGTFAKQYVAVRADFEVDYDTYGNAVAGSERWVTSIYNVSDEVFYIDNITSGNTFGDMLGLNSSMGYLETDTIAKYFVADDLTSLQQKLTPSASNTFGGIISGAPIYFDSTGLTYGTFEIMQDSSMNIQKATKTNMLGSAISSSSVSLTAKLTDVGLSVSGLNGKFTINGVEIRIDDYANLSLNDLMGIVNSSGAGVTMTFDSATNQFKISSNQTGATNLTLGAAGDTSSFFDVLKLSVNAGAVKTTGTTTGNLSVSNTISQAGFTYNVGSGVFTINDVPIYVDAGKDTVEDLIAKVNRSAAGVTLTYDSVRDKFIIVSNSAERIRFGGEGDTSNVLQVMGFMANYQIPSSMVGSGGQNAIIRVDGQTYIRSTNTIDDVLTGVTITATSVGTTTIEIDVDTDKAVTSLAAFIKSYNSMLLKLRPESISREDRNNKMEPLTTEKKSKMSDEEIRAYEEEYDRLHTTDMILKSREFRNLIKDLRANIMDPIFDNTSVFNSLSDIGFVMAGDGDISITQKGYLMEASTDIDVIIQSILENSTLMENLRRNSDEVFKFFGAYQEDTVYIDRTTGQEATSSSLSQNVVPTSVTVYDSWSRRYEKMIAAFQDIEGQIGIKTRVDSAIEKQMTRIAQEIERKQQSAERYLELLWSQFTNMEMRVAAIQSQAEYITQLAERAKSNSSS